MSLPNCCIRYIASFSLLIAVALFAVPVTAQTNWIGANNQQWSTSTNWDTSVVPGTANEDVIITRHTGGITNARLTGDGGLAVGPYTVNSLTIGGGSADMRLQVRGDSAVLTVTNDLTLGGDTFGGRIDLQNNAAGNHTFTVNGNVVSASNDGTNQVQVNAAGSVFNLAGDIDSAAARAGIDGVADNEIDVIINRDNGLVFSGGGAQELNLESFNVGNTGLNIGTISQTIGTGKTVNALNSTNGNVNNNNRTATTSVSVDGGTLTTTGNMTFGQVGNNGGGGTQTANATGNLTVGSGTNAGTVTVGGDLRLARHTETTDNGSLANVATGNVVVDNAGSVLTVNGNLLMGEDIGAAGSTLTANLTVNDGLAILNGIVDGGVSTINLNGGRVNLAGAGAAKAVDTLNFGDGTGTDTLEFAVISSTTALATTTTNIGAAGATIDVTTLGADSAVDDSTVDSWIGGTGTWDATGSNWDLTVTPDSFGAIAQGQEIDLITGALSGGTAVLDAGDLAGWTIFQDATKISVTAQAAVGPSAVIAANIAGTGSAVTRTTDLNIQNGTGQGSDATSLTLSDGASLSLTGAGTDLILGGASGQGNVTQGVLGETNATAVTVAGDLVYGNGGAGTSGGNYLLNSGTLTVTGDIVEGASGAPDPNVDVAAFNISSGVVNSLSVGGSIDVQGFRVGFADGSTSTQTLTGKTMVVNGTLGIGVGTDASKDGNTAVVTGGTGTLTLDGGTAIANTVDIGTDGDSQGTLNLVNGASLTSNGRVYLAGDQTGDQDNETMGTLNINTGASLTVISGNTEIGRDGAGFFTVDGGTYTQQVNNLVLAQNGGANDSRGTVDFTNGATVAIGIGNLSNLNYNNGGGDITQSGAATTVNVSQHIDMGSVTAGRAQNTFTISGGLLDVGVDLNGQDSLFRIVGNDSTVINVGGNLNLNAGSTLSFDLLGSTSVADINLLGTGNANLNDATLELLNASALNTYSTDILLVDTLGTTGFSVGTFAGLAEGSLVAGTLGDGYFITYDYQGNGSTALIFAVPEPSFLALLGIGGVGLVARRRRRS